jgi:hypothetical protein
VLPLGIFDDVSLAVERTDGVEELASVYTVVENVLAVLVHGMLEVTEIGMVVVFETFLIRGSLPISCCSVEDELVPNIEVVIMLVYTVHALVVDEIQVMQMVSIFKEGSG